MTRIAITMGDPAGVGPEVIAKGLRAAARSAEYDPVVIGSWDVMRRAAEDYAPGMELERVTTVGESRKGRTRVLDIGSEEDSEIVPGRPTQQTHWLAVRALEVGAGLAIDGEVDVLVTAPLTKQAFAQIGSSHLGHTEYLAWRAGVRRFAMMFVAGWLRVVLATTHIPLAKVAGALSKQRIHDCVRMLAETLQRDFRIERPHLAVAALNPHAGERSLLGSEEEAILAPAVEACRSRELDVTGPLPADTLFWRMRAGEFDGVVAMYHDQALIPVKLVGFERAVNVTLGLPFIRTSVSHGTAFDLSGRGLASEASFVEALKLGSRMAGNRLRAGK